MCVCTVLSDKSVQEIKMPPTHLDQRRTAHQFFRIKNFLRVIGAIDGKINNNVFCFKFSAIVIVYHFISVYFE